MLKPELTAYRDECRDLIASLALRWTTAWIPREENDYCDEMTRPAVPGYFARASV